MGEASLLRRALRRLRRTAEDRWRTRIWDGWYARFAADADDIDPSEGSRELYLGLAEEVRSRQYAQYPKFFEELEREFRFVLTPPLREFMDGLALVTQVGVKRRVRLLYLHGYLLYAALRHYLDTHPDVRSVTVLETGTARGFSSLCMAKALADADREGRILTVDVIPPRRARYWCCIGDVAGRQDRFWLLRQWRDLIERYIVYLQGHSEIALRQLGLARVHFAFLDDEHTYDVLRFELETVSRLQRPGDVIVCDDYTPSMFPGVVRALDEFLAAGAHVGRLFESGENRGYLHCERTEDGPPR